MSSERKVAGDVAHVLLFLGPLVGKLQQQVLERLDIPLTLRQYRTLAAIADGRETFTALREVLVGSPATISTAIESLESRALITRALSPHDQRWKLIAMTDLGDRALKAAEEALSDVRCTMAGQMPQVSVEVVDDLQRLYEYLHNHFTS